jgi:hypothetical protein
MSNAVPAAKTGGKPSNGAPTTVAPVVTPVATSPIQSKLDSPPPADVKLPTDTKTSKKALFERYYVAQSNVEKAEIEASTTLKAIREQYGKGPFRLKDGLKTIVEREVKDDNGVVLRSLFFFRSVGGEIQEIE